jgi:hypothetical protein
MIESEGRAFIPREGRSEKDIADLLHPDPRRTQKAHGQRRWESF